MPGRPDYLKDLINSETQQVESFTPEVLAALLMKYTHPITRVMDTLPAISPRLLKINNINPELKSIIERHFYIYQRIETASYLSAEKLDPSMRELVQLLEKFITTTDKQLAYQYARQLASKINESLEKTRVVR